MSQSKQKVGELCSELSQVLVYVECSAATCAIGVEGPALVFLWWNSELQDTEHEKEAGVYACMIELVLLLALLGCFFLHRHNTNRIF